MSSFDLLEPDIREKCEELQRLAVADEKGFDSACIRTLSIFSREDQLRVLELYERQNIALIQNVSAYLQTVMTRFRRDRDFRGTGNAVMSDDVQAILEKLYDQDVIKRDDLDEQALSVLAEQPFPIADEALKQLKHEAQTNHLRNVSATLVSTIRKLRQFNARNADRSHGGPFDRGTGRGGGGGGGGGRSMGRGNFGGGRGPPGPGPGPGPGPVVIGVANGGGPGRSGGGYPPPVLVIPDLASIPVKDYSNEQQTSRINIREFQGLSPWAKFVHPCVAHKLVKEWENGLTLIVIMDEKCWEMLAKLDFPLALAVVYEVADQLRVRRMDQQETVAKFKEIATQYLSPNFAKSNSVPAPLPVVRGPGMPPDNLGPGGPANFHQGRPQPGVLIDHGQLPPIAQFTGGEVSGKVRDYIDKLVRNNSGVLTQDHFDKELMRHLSALGEGRALNVLQELERNDLSTIKKMTPYIMGICKRHLKQQHGGGGHHYGRRH